MSKSWYPVIDYLVCKECGSCINKCKHDVYSKEKAPSPVVVQAEKCIENCHGCGNLCPQGAITYVGDASGWIPPYGKYIEDEGNCCCKGGAI